MVYISLKIPKKEEIWLNPQLFIFLRQLSQCLSLCPSVCLPVRLFVSLSLSLCKKGRALLAQKKIEWLSSKHCVAESFKMHLKMTSGLLVLCHFIAAVQCTLYNLNINIYYGDNHNKALASDIDNGGGRKPGKLWVVISYSAKLPQLS